MLSGFQTRPRARYNFTQFGIVDTVRRAQPRILYRITSKIPFVKKIIRKVCNKYHYQLTKGFEFRYSSKRQFFNNITSLIEAAKEVRAEIYFVKIAPPGKHLIKTTYNCIRDVMTYNDLINDAVKKQNYGKIIDPYEGYAVDLITLEEDGRHLTELGHSLVADNVNKALYDSYNSRKGNK